MKLIAHRGASADAPENTMAAFRLALSAGADGLELDVRLTEDRRVVVVHDENLKRTTGRSVKIGKATWPDLRALDAGSWKGARWRGQRVPLLAEVLEFLPNGRRIFVEIKCGAEVTGPLKNDLGLVGARAGDIMLLGFDVETMAALRRSFPRHEVHLNVEPDEIGPPGKRAQDAKRRGFDGVSFGFSRSLGPSTLVPFRDAGLSTAVWVVDDEKTARQMQQWGFDYLMTNKPAALRPVVS